VLLVVDLDDTPWVAAATDLAPIGIGDLVGGTNDGEGDLGHNLVVLRDRLLVIKLVARALEDLNLVELDIRQNSLLEGIDLLVGQGIRLCDNGDQVDLGVKALHNLNVKGLERMAGRLDEENTCVDAVVDDVHPVDFVLSIEISIETLLNVVDDGPPRLIIVHEVAETRRVNNGQS
jgi:hypothetical protein